MKSSGIGVGINVSHTVVVLVSEWMSGSEDQDHFKEDCRWSKAKSKLLT